ncbi:DUF3782 domain-containing protein [Microcystis wesenbergii FACHB-1317]|jgi:hypothetical protein|uniref:DUF3782 domain-containing protein n=1 Tax=Microcystis TaxID=1125 RepID=UPI000E384D19|nr:MULTISPECIES: DUF3782 domain-containing protein [Microcystis]NCQ92642.1 DUF3782 domain-containing protein [Microcystis aeruginosa LG13-13]NCR05628.1 DUF3782 domain-containing protein [Microcystis aeruginosa LG13-03]NCR64094.1 DUF3782 domain-containing protein [Microcystis aeruginosa LG11-05]NCS25262.1 DUF3782 domain-containing protein [Microcystis aeruginosa BS13-02]NCS78892.1 DUF3782 domain-containing protein [Microcystis aeruginosa K13-07]REJ50787.1 MAG: DUF3782 domain-containing protein
MSEPITIEDIYQLFRTSTEEFDRRLRESDRRAEEAKLESDRRAEEAKLESDRHRAEIERLLTQSKLASDRTIAELKRTVDSLTTRWGRFVEELVAPAVLRLFQEKGIDIKELYPRAQVKRQGIAMEIDILAVDERDVVLVECKSRLSQDDVDEFIEKLTRFKIAFPHYKNYQAYGAVAGIEINKGVDRYAYKKGLFVIKPSGDTVVIINDADFQPNTW